MDRAQYIQQLGNLREDLLRLGSMVEYALINAVRSLEHWDTVAAANVINNDDPINEARRRIEDHVIRLIAGQILSEEEPRLLGSVFAIAGELERIGDYAVSIARRVQRITNQANIVVPPQGFSELVLYAKHMLNASLESFVRQDIELAYSLRKQEERVDELEEQIQNDLIALARQEPERIESIVGMLDIVHALERVADRATNIAGRVIYLTVNIPEELNP
ncbi:MAG: phosphate signaling complex protein PhoU [Chloroflexaceae bacterium]|nr:phosphate signaling complex protein PhoU [Chloroflexaceae bacterium]NJO05960.1 phosphate signaling complex protein PhoU [Chloroflexaceae bacterium]